MCTTLAYPGKCVTSINIIKYVLNYNTMNRGKQYVKKNSQQAISVTQVGPITSISQDKCTNNKEGIHFKVL